MVAIAVDGQKARARAVREIDPACKAVGGVGSQPDTHLPAGCGIVAAIGRTGVHHQLGVARGDHHRVDVDVASRRQCQRVRVPADVVIDVDVAFAGRVAARAALDFDVAAGQIRGKLRAGHVAAAGGDGVVAGVDQPGAGLALGRMGGDPRGFADTHRGGTGFDETAVAAVGCASIEQAAVGHGAMVHVTQQQDAAVVFSQRARLHDARVGHHTGGQGICGLAGHDGLAAIGDDELAVIDQSLHGGWIDGDLQQAIGAGIQGDLFAGGQNDVAHAGGNDAVIDDRGRQQRDQTAVGGGDGPLIDDAASRAFAREDGFAIEEVLVGDVQGGGHQPADVHAAAFAKDHAVRVDQPDLAVGGELAVDLAGVAGDDAVQCCRIDRGLLEVHGRS